MGTASWGSVCALGCLGGHGAGVQVRPQKVHPHAGQGPHALSWVDQCPSKIHAHLKPQNVTSFGNRVFVHITSVSAQVTESMRPHWVRVGPYQRKEMWTWHPERRP